MLKKKCKFKLLKEVTVNWLRIWYFDLVLWPPRCYSSAKTIAVSELKSTLRNSSHISASSRRLKPGSHERHKHKQQKQRRILLWDLRRQSNENFSLFRLLFCSLLMLGLWSYAYSYAYDDPYVAGLTWFLFCFLFCPYAYAYAIVWTRLKGEKPG